jgi:hypothetical protein
MPLSPVQTVRTPRRTPVKELAAKAGSRGGDSERYRFVTRKTDARLSTLRKLVRMFTAHGVEFVMEGSRSVTINTTAKDPVRQSSRKVLRTEPATKAEVPDQKTTVEQGLLWLRPFVRVKKADHA